MLDWIRNFRDREFLAWQAGKLDDRAFEAAQVRRTWVVAGLGFLVLLALVNVIVVAGKLSDHEPIRVENVLLLNGVMLVFSVAIAVRLGRFAKAGARNMVLSRHRAKVEANPAHGLPKAMREGAGVPARYFGAYKRSIRYALTVLGLSGLGLALALGMAYYYSSGGYELSPVVGVLIAANIGIAIYGLYMIVDRRTYLELSADGVWCRAWGKQHFAFSQFKAVYGRQRSLQRGVVFVPHQPDVFRKQLSFLTRLHFGGAQAHARTVTLWTTQVDLPRDALLREVQAAVVRAAGVR